MAALLALVAIAVPVLLVRQFAATRPAGGGGIPMDLELGDVGG